MPDKVTLQPCLGTDAVSVLARQACYVVHEEHRPDQTSLGCGPALNATVQEDIDFIRDFPVLALESCDKVCATKLVAKMGEQASTTMMVRQELAGLGIEPEGLPTGHLPCEDPTVQALAQRILAEVDRLLAGG
jgi:uncharacterized metal-binding protein